MILHPVFTITKMLDRLKYTYTQIQYENFYFSNSADHLLVM